MKTRISPFVLAPLLLTACTREESKPVNTTEPPVAVTKAFKAAHGEQAAPSGWEMEDGLVEMEYLVEGVEISELYDTDGNLISTESPIDVATLPVAVRNAISEQFPDGTIKLAERIDSAEDTQYEVEVQSTAGVHEVLYSAEGLPMGEEDDDDGGEDDDDKP